MKRYFICNITPRPYLQKYGVPTAAYNFCEGLMAADYFDNVYSILPLNVYGYKEPFNENGIHIIYSGLRGESKLSRLLSCFIEQIKVFSKLEKECSVWLYNVTILNILLIKLLRLFKPNVGIYTIVLDFTPEDKDDKIALPYINKSNGIIKLSDSPLFNVNNSACLPGVVMSTIKARILTAPLSYDFLISGNVKEQIAMTSMLLSAFSKMPQMHLHISGRAENVDLIKSYADRYSNIHYYGNLAYNDFLNLLDKCPFLLSTRNPNEPRNQCNFPSKVMEGLLYNKIIISTIHYEQLNGIRYIEVPSDEADFINSIKRLEEMPQNELIQYSNQSSKAIELYNPTVWKETMINIENNGKRNK